MLQLIDAPEFRSCNNAPCCAEAMDWGLFIGGILLHCSMTRLWFFILKNRAKIWLDLVLEYTSIELLEEGPAFVQRGSSLRCGACNCLGLGDRGCKILELQLRASAFVLSILSRLLGVASVYKLVLKGCEDLQLSDAGFFREAIPGLRGL